MVSVTVVFTEILAQVPSEVNREQLTITRWLNVRVTKMVLLHLVMLLGVITC